MHINFYYVNFIFVVQLQLVNIVIKRICYVMFNMLRVCTFGLVTKTVIVASGRSFCINTAHTHTIVLLPLHNRSACVSRPVKIDDFVGAKFYWPHALAVGNQPVTEQCHQLDHCIWVV